MVKTERIPSPNNAKDWSQEDDAKLIELRAAGKKWAFIAKTLGRTQASVESRSATIKRRTAGGHVIGTG